MIGAGAKGWGKLPGAVDAALGKPMGGIHGDGEHPATSRRIWRARGAVTVALFAALVAACILGPMFSSNANTVNATARLLSPSGSHWFGTDQYGRDIFTRVLLGGRASLGIGGLVAVLSTVIGGTIGVTAAFVRTTDRILMRVVDGLLAFPPLVLAIALVAFLGAGVTSEIIALVAVFVPFVARVARSSAAGVRKETFIVAAYSSGLTRRSIIVKHIVPNIAPVILVQATYVYALAILADASLSFLGLGVPPPAATWGGTIADSQSYISSAPWLMLFPGIAIMLAVLLISKLGDRIGELMSLSDVHEVIVSGLGRGRREMEPVSDSRPAGGV